MSISDTSRGKRGPAAIENEEAEQVEAADLVSLDAASETGARSGADLVATDGSDDGDYAADVPDIGDEPADAAGSDASVPEGEPADRGKASKAGGTDKAAGADGGESGEDTGSDADDAGHTAKAEHDPAKRGKHAAPPGTAPHPLKPADAVAAPVQAASSAASAPTVPSNLPTPDTSAAEPTAPVPVISVPEVVTADASADGGFVAAGFGEIPKKKRRRALKAFGITLGVLVVVVLVAYIAGAVVFMGRMLPNTVIGEYDISMKADQEVRDLIDGNLANYQLDVIGDGFAYRTDGRGIGLEADSSGIVSRIHEDLDAWRWPLLIIEQRHDETGFMEVSFKPSVYEQDLTDAVNKFNESATPPVNATIAYDEKADKFVVKPEEQGTQLDAKAVLAAMSAAIGELDPKVQLTDEELVKPAVYADDEKLVEAAELASGMVSASITLNMAGQPAGEVNGDTLSAFITVNENFEVVFKEDEMNAWVDSLAAGFNTVGTERTFTRADGKQVVVPAGGIYGWEIDTEALKNAVLEGVKAGAKTQVEIPCLETAAVYNGVGQRDWGNRFIDVDLSEQHVRFYGEDGAIIWETDCISGSPDGTHDTGVGTWRVNNKESPSKLIGYENGKKIYETTVKYWMPFESNSIGFHDATWQPAFGGTMYADGYGSHGCVNISYSAAETLYDIIQIGDAVVVHY